MWPGTVSSDLDVHEVSIGDLFGRWTILVDVRAEFQGAAGAYGLLAIVVAILTAAGVQLGWVENTGRAVSIAAVAFVIFSTVSLYSLLWFYWANKRSKRVWTLLEARRDAEDA